jgi:hypothetical protein
VPARVLHGFEAREDLEQPGLVVGAMPEVARDRTSDRIDILAQQPLERREPPVARRRVRIRIARSGLPLARERLA